MYLILNLHLRNSLVTFFDCSSNVNETETGGHDQEPFKS